MFDVSLSRVCLMFHARLRLCLGYGAQLLFCIEVVRGLGLGLEFSKDSSSETRNKTTSLASYLEETFLGKSCPIHARRILTVRSSDVAA
jgi:hypothetical protein